MMGAYIFAEWIFTFIEVAMFFVIVHATKKDQFSQKKQMMLFPAVAGVIAAGVVLLNLVNFTSMLMTTLYAALVFTIGASILYKGNFLGLMMENLLYIAGLNLIEGVLIGLVSIIWSSEAVVKMAAGFCIERIIIVTAFKLIEILLTFGIYKLIKYLSIELKPSWQAFLVSAIGYIISLFWIIQLTSVVNMKASPFEMIITAVCILVCCIGYFIFRLQRIQQEQEHISLENKLLKMNYQAAEESYESNAKLYHDMRNHFSLLQSYLAEGNIAQAQEYLQKLGGDSPATSIEKRTGMEAIDYILSQKAAKAENLGIAMDIHAEYPKECSIDPVDLCTILTNLLDNAIEACGQLPEGMERKITLTIRRIHQFIIIRLSNSAAAEPVIKNGKLITSKQDKAHHGWGLKSVKSAVEKYQGTMEYKYEDHLFTVSVMMFYR